MWNPTMRCSLASSNVSPTTTLAEKLLEMPAGLIGTAIDLELAEGTITRDTVGDIACVFLSGLYYAEKGIAEHLHRLMTGALPWPEIDADKALPWIERQTGLSLAESQQDAIRLATKPSSTSARSCRSAGRSRLPPEKPPSS